MPTLIRDLSTKGSIPINAANSTGRAQVDALITPLPPGTSRLAPNHAGVQYTVVDGVNGGIPSGIPSERTEQQASPIGTYGREVWYRWVEWFDPSFPLSSTTGDWDIFVTQWHGTDVAPQPYAAMEIRNGRRCLNANGGGGRVYRWMDDGQIELGVEREFRVGVVWSTDPAVGRIWIRSGDRELLAWRGKTAWSASVPYAKKGGYRNAAHNGRATFRVWGYEVWDGDPGPFLGGTPPPPPPPPADEVGPQVTVFLPEPNTVLIDRKLNWLVEAADPSGIAEVKVTHGATLIAREVNAPFGDGSPYNLPDAVPTGQIALDFTAVDTVGNTTRVSVPVVNGVVPPPPPPPPDDIDVIRAELEATKLELAKTEDRLEKAIVMIASARSTLNHDV